MSTSRTLATALAVSCAALALACGGGYDPPGITATTKPAPTQAEDKPVAYETFASKTRADGKVILELIVPEKTTKDEALKLGKALERQYAGRYASISVFDSREAAKRRLDEKYPEKELSRHWLIVIDELHPGEVRWVAEGRPGS